MSSGSPASPYLGERRRGGGQELVILERDGVRQSSPEGPLVIGDPEADLHLADTSLDDLGTLEDQALVQPLLQLEVLPIVTSRRRTLGRRLTCPTDPPRMLVPGLISNAGVRMEEKSRREALGGRSCLCLKKSTLPMASWKFRSFKILLLDHLEGPAAHLGQEAPDLLCYHEEEVDHMFWLSFKLLPQLWVLE